MIRKSFIFLDKIKYRKERNIWKNGIHNWDDFLRSERVVGIDKEKKGYFDRKIIEARSNLYNEKSGYFVDKLPNAEHWRLYKFFREDAVFLDIEVNGVGRNADITVIGLYDGTNTKTMVKDVNMDIQLLRQELQKHKLIVSFNGKSFDIPHIKNRYGEVIPDMPHMDLKHLAPRTGLKGGLKDIEKKLGIRRVNELIDKMQGGDASCLYRMFKGSGDKHYLELLVEYNEEDCVNLQKIADYIYEKLESEICEIPKLQKIENY